MLAGAATTSALFEYKEWNTHNETHLILFLSTFNVLWAQEMIHLFEEIEHTSYQ